MFTPCPLLGTPIPAHTAHAVSVSLPRWSDNVDYEEGVPRVVDALQAGYPRFVFHPSVRALMRWAYRVTATTHAPVGVTTAGASVHVDDASDSGHVSDAATIIGDDSPPVLLFMRRRPADACRDYITAARIPPSLGIAINTADDAVRVVELDVGDGTPQSIDVTSIATLYVVVFPHALAAVAKQFWQHAGEGLSSRAAEFVLERVGVAVAATTATNAKVAPVATTTTGTAVLASATATATSDTAIYVEERFGRNMERSQGALAKAIIKERLGEAFYGEAMTTMSSTSSASTHSPRDDYPIWLYPSGMSAIYNAHRLVREALPGGGERPCVQFGFPYIDTLKVLERFAPPSVTCHFYAHGDAADLTALRTLLASTPFHLRPLAIFCEFPSNPLLHTPDLHALHELAVEYSIALVVDETLGNPHNVHLFPHADMVVSSLTKVFSGDSNVMGGMLALNPASSLYTALREKMQETYVDNWWMEDAIFMERNSRDFRKRIARMNGNAEVVCEVLRGCAWVDTVYYPKINEDRALYDACRRDNGGYGGLLSVTFKVPQHRHCDSSSGVSTTNTSKSTRADHPAATFYDTLTIAKGPSLGTNFTLACPYTILAHYTELPFAERCGISRWLVRVSVGLEEEEALKKVFGEALREVERVWGNAPTAMPGE